MGTLIKEKEGKINRDTYFVRSNPLEQVPVKKCLEKVQRETIPNEKLMQLYVI